MAYYQRMGLIMLLKEGACPSRSPDQHIAVTVTDHKLLAHLGTCGNNKLARSVQRIGHSLCILYDCS